MTREEAEEFSPFDVTCYDKVIIIQKDDGLITITKKKDGSTQVTINYCEDSTRQDVDIVYTLGSKEAEVCSVDY